MDINGNFISKVKAGANADNIVFTKDGSKLLVANEGEPNVGYTIDPEGSVSIINLAGGAAGLTQANVQTAGFTSFNSPTVIDPKIRIFGRIQTTGGAFLRNSTVAEDLEPEYITVSDDGTTAWVTCQENNCIAVVNINTATITALLPLGYKNHNLAGNGLDPSDKDGTGGTASAKIATWPVFGLFLPDGISSYKVGTQTYLVTANEGDSRADWGAANLEENRVKDAAYVLDTVKFGGASMVAMLKADSNLGRLTVTNRYGDFNNDGKFDSIFAFGGRSFSIWNATTGALVWDSKDEFERITLAAFPANFNTGHTTNAMDDRSDNKGPEPESVTVGKIKDSTYAFVALERIGGVMIYNITTPTAPYFVQYINARDFAITPGQANLAAVGDLGPEGIVFIPSSESPNGQNMLMLSNEVSSTVSVFTITTPETQDVTKIQDYKNNTSAPIGTYQGINFREAGFSTLFPIPNTNGTEFWTCSDRGVNVDCANANLAGCRPTYDKMYAFPSYSPKIHRIRIVGDSIQILQSITIKRPNGTGSSGIINPTGLGSTATEVASTDTVLNCANFNTKTTPKDTFGIDPEGLVVDKNGFFWLCEEGGATIWKLDPNGVLIKRYTPYANLAGVQSVDTQIDTVFKYRKNNRGFEGISITPSGKIYAFIQSPILFPTKAIGEASRVHRILEIDPATGNQRMLAYLNDGVIGTGSDQIRTLDWKIGDMSAINDSTFLVIEAGARGASDIKRVYQININQATAVHSGLYGGLTLEGLVDSTGLANNNIKPVTKKLVVDLLASGWPSALDKSEGLAIINDSTIAVANDNDFGQTCPNADGIAIATTNVSHVITYRLSGTKKLQNYKPAVSAVSSQSAYLTPAAAGVKLNAILTAGDNINGYTMAGTPDGLGAFDNGNGTFTLVMNHEFGNTAGGIRAHGSKGAFVSKWVINKNDLTVVSGSDLIKRVNVWNKTTLTYNLLDSANASSLTAFNRFCSADLPAVSAFYNATTGKGTQERIFMNGEESGAEGRAFGHIVTGTAAGTSYELPYLGKFSWENSVASPTAQDKTIVAGMDDSTPGQVYFYIGTKGTAGTDIEKAGLANGKLYGIAVTGLATETSTVPAANSPFTLADLGVVRDSTGASLDTRSNNAGVTTFLRPEDGAWDPSNPNDFYFATTNAITSPSRLWRVHFSDIANPELGGTITAVLDGTEGQKMLDNLTIDKYGHVLLVEDVGGNVHLGKTWQYTIATDKLELIASHDSTRFISGGVNFLTQDEEASGILDVQDILGAGNFMVVDQAHYPVAGEVVEGGQLLKLFNPATANAAAGALASSSQPPYLVSAAAGVKINSIITAGDKVNGYTMAGTPDGLGAFDNGNGTFTLVMNHEFGNTAGVNRAHGSKGAFVSKWVINKNDLTVISGADLIKRVNVWNKTTLTYNLLDSANASSLTAFNRFCSADLPAVTAFFNAATGKGTQERIFMNGEESGAEGRAFGHIITGAAAGTSYELPYLGKFSWENSVASPTAQDKTIVAGMDDSTPGQVYFYIGTKTNTGTDIEKAGLSNGKLYGIAVTGLATETSTVPAANSPFTLADLGVVRDSTGASLDTRSNNLGVTTFLRPEDGAWDPSNPNDFYFATTNAITSPSRLWKVHFTNIATPELGGTITAVLDGTEGQKMLDNLTIDKYGHILLVEDVGGNVHLGKTWQYTIATDKLDLVASHDSSRFITGGANFLTQDEEASGILDVQDILGAGNFLVVDQAHYPVAGEVVEGGQLLKLFNQTTANSAAGALASSSQTPYLTPAAAGVKINSIITAGDKVNGYTMAGTPDGLGAFDNGNGTFTLLMNHEFGNTAGVNRAHGSKGAFVSKWVINKNDLTVVSGADLIKRVNVWNKTTQTYNLLDSANASSLTAFNRFCSADLPAVTAFFNATTGKGTQERIFMNGEESGAEGRAFGHIATGTNAGTTYELPALGKFSWENSVASPTAQDKTIVAGMDDSTPGQVYFYIGTKTNTGTEIEKAGLTNGKLYGIAVTGLVTETSTVPAANSPFTLADLGNVKDSTGASLDTRSNNLGVTTFLRPEDGAWDPSNPNDFYFATTNAITSPSRLWRVHFTNIATPELGGTITAVLDGTEGQKMLDNITIDKTGHILLVEDVGGNVHLGKTWQYTIATDKLDLIASHDSTRFISGGANFLTQDEEASGILDVQDILGAGNFLVVDQAHYPVAGEVVEGGQLLKLFNPATAAGIQLKTIADARLVNPNDTVRVKGIVTRAWGRFIYIQDSTGAIGVRQASGAMVDSITSGGIKEGDYVEVLGGRGDFNNYAQIAIGTGAYGQNSAVKVIARNQPLPPAKLVTLKQLNTNAEQYESQLVRVVGLKTSATGSFAASTNYTVWDGKNVGDTMVLRAIAAADTEIDDAPATAIPTDEFAFEGTLIQFCSSPASGCTSGYQLQVVRKYEIQPVVIKTIAQARAITTTDSVRVRGIVTRAWGRFIYIQDSTGAIGVRQASGAMVDSITSGGIKEGDYVDVSGARGDFNNYAQIQLLTGGNTANSFVKVISRNQPLPAAKLVTLKQLNTNGEQYESQLVRVVGLRTSATGNFAASTNYTIWDGTTAGDTMVYRVIAAADTEVDDAPGLSIPSGKFTFEGTLIQFCSSPTSGCVLGYQLQGLRKYEITAQPQLSSFNLVTPVNGTRIVTSANNPNMVSFKWNKSANATQYKWFITTPTGDFSNAWLRSGALGTNDTTFSYANKDFDTLVAKHAIVRGDSVMLKWSVYAYFGGDSLLAAQYNDIKIVREAPPVVVPSLNPFNLLTPADNGRIEVEANDNTPVMITWTSSAPGANYRVLVDESTANFTSPWLVMQSDTNGTATRLTLTSGAIDGLLAANAIAKGDSVNLKWTVRAFKAADSLQATQVYHLTAVRKQSVGLFETSLNTKIELYPNPTSANTILSMNLEKAESIRVTIADIQGKVVTDVIEKDGTNGIQQIELPTASLQNGIYFVNINVGGKAAQVKLVVMH
jgi:hypothetical protein